MNGKQGGKLIYSIETFCSLMRYFLKLVPKRVLFWLSGWQIIRMQVNLPANFMQHR